MNKKMEESGEYMKCATSNLSAISNCFNDINDTQITDTTMQELHILECKNQLSLLMTTLLFRKVLAENDRYCRTVIIYVNTALTNQCIMFH